MKKLNEAIRVLEEADIQANFEEEQRNGEVNTRSRINRSTVGNEVERPIDMRSMWRWPGENRSRIYW